MLQRAQESRSGPLRSVSERSGATNGPAEHAVCRFRVLGRIGCWTLRIHSPEALTLVADLGTAFGIDFDSIFVVSAMHCDKLNIIDVLSGSGRA